MTMTPQKKANSQITASIAASKGKKVINGGTDPAEIHLSNINVVLQQINEKPF